MDQAPRPDLERAGKPRPRGMSLSKVWAVFAGALPAIVSLARSGKPSSRPETKKGDFPKSNVEKLNSA